MANYVSGETTDWDNVMIVAAIFKAVARSILASPANHVDDVALLADVFDSADPRAYGVPPFPRKDFGAKSGDTMIAECIPYGDRMTVVSGKSVSVRVDPGGGRLIKKKYSALHNNIEVSKRKDN